MLFYPSESLIIGLFLLAAIFFIIHAAYGLVPLGTITAERARYILSQQNINKWLGRLFLLLALIMAFISSLLPLEY